MELIQVEKINENTFLACNLIGPESGLPAFGGQTISQSLLSATIDLPKPFKIQSLCTHFLRPVLTNQPLKFIVEEIKNGKNILIKKVNAYQNNKLVLFTDITFTSLIGNINYQCKQNCLYATKYVNLESWLMVNEEGVYGFLDPKILENWRFVLKFTKYFEIQVSDPPVSDTTNPDSPNNNKSICRYARELKFSLKNNINLMPTLTFLSDFFIVEVPLLIFKNKPENNLKLIISSKHNLYYFESPEEDELTFYYLIECHRIVNGIGMCEGYLFDSKRRHILTAVQEVVLV